MIVVYPTEKPGGYYESNKKIFRHKRRDLQFLF